MAGHIIKHLSTGFYVCDVVIKRDGGAASIDLADDPAKAHIFKDKTQAIQIAAKWLGAHDYELVEADADPDRDKLQGAAR